MQQKQQILNYLKGGNTLTPVEALNKFGCMRLGARIYDLKRDGHPIVRQLVGAGKKYAQYRLLYDGGDR